VSRLLPAKLKDHLLEVLRCPQQQIPLMPADGELLARVNNAIREGRICNQTGERRSEPIDGGLVRAAGDVLYPIVDGIPLLLWDEAIALDQLSESQTKKN
jgi:uncharacterized protein YbaR (Trm112 family)